MAALMIHCNIEISHWRKVIQCLKMFMGIKSVCVEEQKWRDLGKGHGKVYSSTYQWDKEKGKKKGNNKKKRPERVTYWWKDPVDEFLRNLSYVINGNNLNPSEIEFVQVVNGADHGKLKFRFTAKLIVKACGKYYEQIYPIGDVKCSKDTGELLRETLLPKISDGVNYVSLERVNLYKNGTSWI